jgi:hypothetical protein
MYTRLANPLEAGDVYYIIKSNANPLVRKEDEEYALLEFCARKVTPTVCYGDLDGEVVIHSLKNIYKSKVKALMELKRLYTIKKNIIEGRLREVEDKLTGIQEELPYV